MKKIKLLLLAMSVAFLTTNCIVLPSYTSEGSMSSPVSLSHNTYHGGEVDGSNSSYYVYYANLNGTLYYF
jgi:hypothetical protein